MKKEWLVIILFALIATAVAFGIYSYYLSPSRLIIVFRTGTSELRVRQILREVHVNDINQLSSSSFYVVSLPITSGVNNILKKLESYPEVESAEADRFIENSLQLIPGVEVLK